MKKILLSAIGVGLLSLASCSSEEAPKPTPTEGQQVLTIRVDDATRRVIDSSAAANSVQTVRVFIYSVDGDGYYNPFANKTFNWSEAVDSKLTWVISDDAVMASDGEYFIRAIAYEAATDYTDISNKNLEAQTDDYNLFYDYESGMILDPAQLNCSGVVNEIFAAEKDLAAADDKDAIELTLSRQVAGAFFYVEDIPYVEGMTGENSFLVLEASKNLNTSLFLGKYEEDHVVNGFNAGTSNEIVSVKLGDWFNTFADTDNDGKIDMVANENSTWITTGHDNFKPGAVFGSAFLIPMDARTDDKTSLTLKLKVADEVKYTWKLKLKDGQKWAGVFNQITYDNTNGIYDWNNSSSAYENNVSYNLYRNHLYTLGAKPTKTYSSETDKPEALTIPEIILQELTLSISDNWNVINTETEEATIGE